MIIIDFVRERSSSTQKENGVVPMRKTLHDASR